ncbi:hypothetical protein [Halorhodospira halophila]|uniref:hypothetical protein n=1 Tax=Halorhodospira halophila TaxID=1053 RepID=UPI001912B282|nr:hypothetical protein [Halorhodospira halophila]MBK5942703.1 hypothetical protein [Halorhodospira halophila]
MSQKTRTGKMPAVPKDASPQVREFLEAVKETVEVSRGDRGDPLDKSLTLREAADLDLASVREVAARRAGMSATDLLIPRGQLDTVTTPPQPSGVEADGAFGTIILSWDQPGYANHSRTVIYRAGEGEDFGQAVRIGSSTGVLYSNAVGQNAVHRYWVQHVSDAGVEGPVSESVTGETSRSPENIMENLLAERWRPDHQYRAFNYVAPDEGDVMLRCIAPGVSGPVEPEWPSDPGLEVEDGSVTWLTVPAKDSVPFLIGEVDGEEAVVINVAYIADASIENAKIGSVAADKITADALSAISANLGSITAGQIDIGDGRFQVDPNGNVTITRSRDDGAMSVSNDRISVYDGNGTLRVRIGRL